MKNPLARDVEVLYSASHCQIQPFSWSLMPKCLLYQLASALWSSERKKNPPMPVTCRDMGWFVRAKVSGHGNAHV